MIELANEILKFTDDLDESFINDYNEKLARKEQIENEREKARRKELEEIRNQPYVPKSGYIFLIQIPNATHKFTYTTSLTKDQKVERIKLENGDTVQILHVLEAYDTMQLLHQFLKKQFSNRAINSNHSIFKLMDEDIEYIWNEVYPSNAMEWLNGSI